MAGFQYDYSFIGSDSSKPTSSWVAKLVIEIITELIEFGFKIKLVLADSLYGESSSFTRTLDVKIQSAKKGISEGYAISWPICARNVEAKKSITQRCWKRQVCTRLNRLAILPNLESEREPPLTFRLLISCTSTNALDQAGKNKWPA